MEVGAEAEAEAEADAEVNPQTALPGKSIRLNEATLTSFQLDGG